MASLTMMASFAAVAVAAPSRRGSFAVVRAAKADRCQQEPASARLAAAAAEEAAEARPAEGRRAVMLAAAAAAVAAIGGAGGAIAGAATAPRCPYGTYRDAYGDVYCR